MTIEFDWAAPIEPGRSMLGLTLGMSIESVKEALERCVIDNEHTIAFRNSPKILADHCKEGLILLRAANIKDVVYQWQNVLCRLVFSQGHLSCIIVKAIVDDRECHYKGKMFGKFGLGSKIADLLEYGTLEYDDAEEVFYPDESLAGMEIGGMGACDLSTRPDQAATSIKIY